MCSLLTIVLLTRYKGDGVMIFIYSLPFSLDSKADYKYDKYFSLGGVQNMILDH